MKSYINFKHAKGVSPGQQSKQYLHLQRVLEYLRHGGASGGYNWNAEQRGVLDNLITSMDAIRTQVSSTKPPRQRVDVEDLQAAGKWVPWKSLAAAATKYANSVLDQCTRAAALDDQELRGRLAPQVSDAMMAESGCSSAAEGVVAGRAGRGARLQARIPARDEGQRV